MKLFKESLYSISKLCLHFYTNTVSNSCSYHAGSSEESYIQHWIDDITRLGYRYGLLTTFLHKILCLYIGTLVSLLPEVRTPYLTTFTTPNSISVYQDYVE